MELGGGKKEEEEGKEITWHSARQIYVHLSPGDHTIYGNKIKPQERPREKLGIEETARQGVQNDRLPRLGSFRVSLLLVRYSKRTRHVT